ncbi:hypothetical protein BGX31_001056 [Mortierella sp. GBA43]|nr:hypothetical protein BGX31_001056 [Mortierella sp. GBA43]
MADVEVKGLDREKMHEPLLSYLDGLKGSSDPYLVYQAAYAYQALLCVPDNESLWQATLRRTGKVVKGVSGLVSAVKAFDVSGFIDGLGEIQRGLAGAAEVIRIVKDAYEGVSSLAQGGQGFLECLKEGLSFNRKCAWYPALRGADTMIQEGQLAEFRKLICEAPCRRDPAFQWGVCQRLGELAANTVWDIETRRSAIMFLREIYCDDVEWGQQATVKQWILGILIQLSSTPEGEAIAAGTLLQDLQTNGDSSKKALYRSCQEAGSGNHPLKVGLPAVGSPSLLDRVQERPDVEGSLRQLRRQRLKERGSAVYIPPQAKANLQAANESQFSLMEKIDEFLAGEQMVFLVLGDSGAGKSTFNKELECQLWQAYKKKSGPIPLHINLPAIDKPEHDMIAKQLRKVEFTEPQIRELKLHRSFILICDGYDESQQTHNLYTSNRLNQPGEWKAKMVISCRSEYLGVDYRDRFQPGDRNQRSESSLLQEAVITPFSMDQVQDYIHQYVSVHRPLWEADDYKGALDLIPSLKELVKNPFLMSLSLEVLPRMVDPGQDLSSTQITRVALYDQFIAHWLERGKKRLGEKNLSPQARGAFESLIDEGFTRNGISYLKRMSAAIYREQGGQPIVSYSRYQDESSWKSEFFSREEEKQLLREACPLIRNGNQHRFIHRSLLEYGVALAVFDPQDWKEMKIPESSVGRRGSMSSLLSLIEEDPSESLTTTGQHELSLDSPIAWRNFVGDPSVLQFLEERVHQEPLFKQQLLDCIEKSKLDKKWRTAASNGITILIRAGVQFNHADLRGIQIPKADLSYGVLDSAQLQGADLRHVDLRGTWLRQADLSKARLAGAIFGELPLLEQESDIKMAIYSPNGATLSVSLSDYSINVYSTSTWDKLFTLSGHTNEIMRIAYSPKGDQLASASADTTVRLWDIETGECIHILQGYDGWAYCVTFSPDGNQVASGNRDSTLNVWDVHSGECLYYLIGHTESVIYVTYSPSGDQLASSSGDGTIHLWDLKKEECHRMLERHDDWVDMVVYSPSGDRLASAGGDDTVRLWDVTTGDCLHVFSDQNGNTPFAAFSPKGDLLASASRNNTLQLWDVDTGACLHTMSSGSNDDTVKSVDFSSHGDLIVSASSDKTVRLWDPNTGACRQTLTGHTRSVYYAEFSPNGRQVVSLSDDKTVRVWDVGTTTSRHASNGHNWAVWSIKCSPQGGQLATGSSDKTLRFWDISTGSCTHTLVGHTEWIRDVVYSPQGNYIASACDDTTVKLWDTETGDCLHTFTGHTTCVTCVAFSPDGSQLVSGCDDGTLRLWDMETKECTRILNGHFDSVWTVNYSPAGDTIVSGSEDSTLRLWDPATADCRGISIGHSDRVYCTAYSPNGSHIASGGWDQTIRLWDVASGAALHTLTGHEDEVNGLAFSPQGDLLLSCSDDKSVALWDVASGQRRALFQVFSAGVVDVAWIMDSGVDYVLSTCVDGSMAMWRVVMGDDDQYQMRVRWRVTRGELDVDKATIQDVTGLSRINKQLLKQRGAQGEPADRMRAAINKVVSMASVIARLKEASSRAQESKLRVTVEELEQRAAKDPLVRDILAALIKDIRENQ